MAIVALWVFYRGMINDSMLDEQTPHLARLDRSELHQFALDFRIGSAGGLLPPPPTPPDMRVRVRRFLAVHPD